MYIYKKVRTDSLIILHVRRCSYGSISTGNQSNFKITFVLQNDAHGYTDNFARALMSVRVDFEGKPSKYFSQNIGINTYPRVSHACMSNVNFLSL